MSAETLKLSAAPVEGLKDTLYNLLYGADDIDTTEAELRTIDPKVGICTAQWGSRRIAFRCLECETDSCCVICPPCYFASNHEGHRVHIIRTGNGCCDCGDEGSWKKEGFCPNHGQAVTTEFGRATMDLLKPVLRDNARIILAAAVQHCDATLLRLRTATSPRGDESERAVTVLRWLNQVASAFLGFRFIVIDALMEKGDTDRTRAYEWLCVNHRLAPTRRHCATAIRDLLVTLVQTSREFKMHVAWCYIHNYGKITRASMQGLDDSLSTDWGSLTVQLLTIEEVAVGLRSPGDCVGMCFFQIATEIIRSLRLQQRTQVTPVHRRLTFQLSNADLTIVQMIHDLGFILRIPPVSKALLFGNDQVAPARKLLCDFLTLVWKTCPQTRYRIRHIGHENQDAVVAFQFESMFNDSLNSLTAMCRLHKRTFEEVENWYIYLRDALMFVLNEDLLPSLDEISFHILFLRFFVRTINWDLLMADLDGGREQRWLDLFPVDFLLRILREALGPLSFVRQINSHVWVRNGESMHDQAGLYEGRDVPGFVVNRSPASADIVGAQFAMVLLAAHKEDAARHLLKAVVMANIPSKIDRNKKNLVLATNEFIASCAPGVEDLSKWQLESTESSDGSEPWASCSNTSSGHKRKLSASQDPIRSGTDSGGSVSSARIGSGKSVGSVSIGAGSVSIGAGSVSIGADSVSIGAGSVSFGVGSVSIGAGSVSNSGAGSASGAIGFFESLDVVQDIWWSILVALCDPHFIELYMMEHQESQRQEISLRRELVNLLAPKRQTQKHLESLVSSELKKLLTEEQWAKVLGEIGDVTYDQQKRFVSLKASHMCYFDTTFSYVFLNEKARALEAKAEDAALNTRCGMLGPALSNPNFYSTVGSSVARRILQCLVEFAFPMVEAGPVQVTIKKLKLIRLQDPTTWGMDFLKTVDASSNTFLSKICTVLKQNILDDIPSQDALNAKKTKQRDACKSRQAAILERMRQQQAKFTEPGEDMDEEPNEWFCCMCREGSSTGTLGYLCYAEPRPSFKTGQPMCIGWTTCGHLIHVSCGSTIMSGTSDTHRYFYDSSITEFDCPVCRGLSNWILPISDTDVQVTRSHPLWKKLTANACWSVVDSIVLQILGTTKWTPHIVEVEGGFFSTLICALIADESRNATDPVEAETSIEDAFQIRLESVFQLQGVTNWSQVDCMRALVQFLAVGVTRIEDFRYVADLLITKRSYQLLAKIVPDIYQRVTTDAPKTALEMYRDLPSLPVPLADFEEFLRKGCWALRAVADVLIVCMWDMAPVEKTKLAFAIQEGGENFDTSDLFPIPLLPAEVCSSTEYQESVNLTGAAPFPASVTALVPKLEDRVFPRFPSLPREYRELLRFTYNRTCSSPNCEKVPIDPYFCLRCGEVVCIGMGCGASSRAPLKGGCGAHSLRCGSASIFLSVYNVHLIAISSRGFCGLWDEVPYLDSNGDVTDLSRCLSLRADAQRLQELERIYCTSIRREIFRHCLRTSRYFPQPFEI